MIDDFMSKLSRNFADIIDHENVKRSDLDPVLPAGDVSLDTFRPIHDRFRADYMAVMDSIIGHWTTEGSTSIQAATDEVIQTFEDASKSRTELQEEAQAERSAKIAAEQRAAEEAQARSAAEDRANAAE